MKLVIGLGNPGERFLDYRSNIGFKILDVIANNNDIKIRTKKKKSLIGRGNFEGEEIVLLKPQTYAALSGEAALYIASFLRIQPKDIIVIMEDVSLSFGKIIMEGGGEDGAHPAIENLHAALKSADFIRLRVGIGGEESLGLSREEYINQEFSPEENIKLIKVINDVEATIRSFILGGVPSHALEDMVEAE